MEKKEVMIVNPNPRVEEMVTEKYGRKSRGL